LKNPLAYLWNLVRWREDFLPGTPPDVTLEPRAWTETAGEVSFAVLGDNGSGRRNAMAVARRMALTYRESPYGLVLLAGDVCYYGHIDDRYETVFTRPYRALIDAGVSWELAVGNHDVEGGNGGGADEVAAELSHFGKDRSYYAARHGPVEVFVVDSGMVLAGGDAADEQLAWLATALGASRAPWKVAPMHHPTFSSGRHGSSMRLRRAVEPILAEGGADLAFAGHDHHYERTTPQRGVVHVVSGGGCKLTLTGRSAFTAAAESALHFVHVVVRGERLDARAIVPDGRVIDRFTLQHPSPQPPARER
jgi:Calcineurin-like phosphoesterase